MAIALCIAKIFGSPCLAQDQYRYFAPTKDVAMLVDVSVSVRDDKPGHKQAQKIIQDILSGVKPSFEAHWELTKEDPSMRELFANYLGIAATATSAELRPLMTTGNSFLSLPVGELSTVLNGPPPRKLRDVTGIPSLVSEGYPKRMDDTSTCYWFAMAHAAGTLSQKSILGYYLFVVSDEEDDPDYREDGPIGHTKPDYVRYTKELERTYPVDSIKAAIGKYFKFTKLSPQNVELYKPQDSFKQVPIARFIQKTDRGGGSRGQKVRLTWYAMGVTPVKHAVPKAPPPVPRTEPGAPPPPLAYQPPVLKPRIQLLGGLDGATKRFEYDRPILVWQIANLDSSGWDAGGRPSVEVDNSNSKRGGLLKDSPRKTIKSWQLAEQLENGTHELNLELEDVNKPTEPLSEGIKIIKAAGTGFWLTVFAILSAVAALAIFIFAWRTLRQNRVVSPA